MVLNDSGERASSSSVLKRLSSDRRVSFRQVLEMSVLLGNENTESKIPLRDLRLRFRRDPVASSELPGKSFLLEKVFGR